MADADGSSTGVDVTLVVPVQKADGRVREVVEGLGAELQELGRSWEAVLVFDGCRGPAWEEAEALAAERPTQVRVIGFQQPFGASACLAEGFDASSGAVLVTTPPYLQVEPADIGRLLQAIDGGAELVSPWRHPRVDPLNAARRGALAVTCAPREGLLQQTRQSRLRRNVLLRPGRQLAMQVVELRFEAIGGSA